MSFTKEHTEVLEKHKHLWIGLRDIQVIRNLEPSEFDALQKVYLEAVGATYFSSWCGSCVSEMITLLYKRYEMEVPALSEEVKEEVRTQFNNALSGKKRRRHGQQVPR